MSDTTISQPWTVGRLLAWTRSHFESKSVDAPRLAAELLLARALGCRKIDLYTRFEQVPTAAQLDVFRESVKAAARLEPIAYLIGRKEFYSLEFAVSPDVLIPRPETEILVEQALAWCAAAGPRDRIDILDIGTGSGCIAVTLAKRQPNAHVVATDMSPGALAIAARNAATHQVAQRISFLQVDLLPLPPDGTVPVAFDLVVSNPPYVARAAPETLDESVRRYEPELALYGGDDGLAAYRRIAPHVAGLLKPGGRVILEIGRGQAEAVQQIICEHSGLSRLATRRDLAGIDRVLTFGSPT